jgi:hypothetical protein
MFLHPLFPSYAIFYSFSGSAYGFGAIHKTKVSKALLTHDAQAASTASHICGVRV